MIILCICSVRSLSEISDMERAPVSMLPCPPDDHHFALVNLYWVPMDQALAIRRTPLGLIIDPTAKTNGLGFPLANAVSFDSNDKTILWGFCLLGEGECKSAFRFLLNVLLCVYGLFVMTAVPLTTTDGDSNLYGPVYECISCGYLGGATYIIINHSLIHIDIRDVQKSSELTLSCICYPFYLHQ